MTFTTITLTAPDVAVVAEIDSGSGSFASVLAIQGATKPVLTADLVSQTTFSDLDSAFAAARAIDPYFDGSALYGPIEFTEVNVSDEYLSFTAGSPATINCEVSSSAGTLTYEWYKDGQLIPNAEGSSLSTSSFVSGQAGQYSCAATATDTATGRQVRFERTFTVTETIVPPALTSATALGIS